MPITVKELFNSVDKEIMGQVLWNEKIGCNLPGVYCVSISDNPEVMKTIQDIPISTNKVEEWINYVPGMRIDGKVPTAECIMQRLSKFWLPSETILYIGKAGRSLENRVNQYYITKLGDRSPHAGGHWIKTLSNLSNLSIYWTTSEDKDPGELEQNLLGRFADNVYRSNELYDANHPFPFANLEFPRGNRKRHGISKSVIR